MIDSSDSFLALYDYSLFANENSDNRRFLFPEIFSQVVFFSSSPGGGKSSLFHLFSPDVLSNVWNSKEQHKDLWKYLFDLETVDDVGVRMLGIEFSCARNYSIIEDVFDKTLSQQVFFALLNVRLLKESLKSILNLKKATSKEGVSYLNKEIVKSITIDIPKDSIQNKCINRYKTLNNYNASIKMLQKKYENIIEKEIVYDL